MADENPVDLAADCGHIVFHDGGGLAPDFLDLLDQRALPRESRRLVCRDVAELVDAIKSMAVRGAPAIGVAAAYGCVLAADGAESRDQLFDLLDDLARARPTAVNLAWAVARMRKIADSLPKADPFALRDHFLREARAIHGADIAACRAIGKFGSALIDDGDCVLTHCNAGALATGGYGTALGVIRAAFEAGKKIKVIADETRPLFQGARLTAHELRDLGIPVRIACDNACALIMSRGMAQKVVVGADRIAANGDTANKIGTFGVAIIAARFGIPFYVAAPLSTIDPQIADGGQIPIEQRSREEVCVINGREIAPESVPALNFAFDVTPAELIAGIITEVGVLRPPYKESIARAMKGERP